MSVIYEQPLISWPNGLGVYDAFVHAAGVLTTQQSNFEAQLEGLLIQYLDVPVSARAYLFDELHNQGRLELIRLLVSAHEQDEAIQDAIKHCLKCFDICAENRNLLAHARLAEIGEVDITMLKPSAKDPTSLTIYTFKIDDIRAAAKSSREGTVYASNLIARWAASLGSDATPLPLPDRPQTPRKLDLCRP